jgi:hypothetical protein
MTLKIKLQPASVIHRNQMLAQTFSANEDQAAAIWSSDLGSSLEEIHSAFWRYYSEVQTVKSLIETGQDFSAHLLPIDTDIDIVEKAA